MDTLPDCSFGQWQSAHLRQRLIRQWSTLTGCTRPRELMADRPADISRAGSSSIKDASHYLLKALGTASKVGAAGYRGQGTGRSYTV